MLPLISQQTYKDNQVIYKEEDSSIGLYIILSGIIELSRIFKGKRFVIETLKQGHLFGESDFMGRKRHTTTATARGEVTLGLIDQKPLTREFNRLPDYLKSALSALSDRNNRLIDMACEMVSRADPRIARSLAVSFQKDDQTTVKAYACDISSGGLFIKTDDPLERGRQFALNLYVPGLSEPLELQCEAVWARNETEESSKPKGMGVKFLEVPDKNRQILDPYIKTIERINIKSFTMSEKDTRILKEYLGTIEHGPSPV